MAYLRETIHQSFSLTLALLLLAFSTGVQDAATYPDYSCFVSNQTGNSILFAVGAFRLSTDTVSLSNTCASLLSFVMGVVIFGQLGNYFGVGVRWWLLYTNVMQTSLVFAAVGLQWAYPIGLEADQDDLTAVVVGKFVIALLGFSSGAQVGMVRALGIRDITTAMATAAYVELFIDPNLFSAYGKNPTRTRRSAFLLCLIAGSFAGAAAYRSMGSAFTLLISAVGKALVTAIIASLSGDRADDILPSNYV